MPLTLLYHDVVPWENADASGFPGPGAAHYKLAPDAFRLHLDAIAAAVGAPPSIDDCSGWMLTFDDGGITALAPTADLLEQRGWRGWFFITTDRVGEPTFLNPDQIRELRRRGHVVGSHSCSHPPRLSHCPPEQIDREWSRSREALTKILGEPVTSASVPGGFHSPAVARSAAAAGYKILFNSEPSSAIHTVDGCKIIGRYAIVRGTSAGTAAALAEGRLLPRLKQASIWNVKKAAKFLGGDLYLRLRSRFLAKAYRDGMTKRE